MLVGTAPAYAVLFIAVFFVGGSGPDTTTAGAEIIADLGDARLIWAPIALLVVAIFVYWHDRRILNR